MSFLYSSCALGLGASQGGGVTGCCWLAVASSVAWLVEPCVCVCPRHPLHAAHNRQGSITGRPAPPGQPWAKAFNVFNALGSIAFGERGRVHAHGTRLVPVSPAPPPFHRHPRVLMPVLMLPLLCSQPHPAYNFTGVLMEVQDTLHEPPKALVNMKRAVHTGMVRLCVCGGGRGARGSGLNRGPVDVCLLCAAG
jgi:hypothetical protein